MQHFNGLEELPIVSWHDYPSLVKIMRNQPEFKDHFIEQLEHVARSTEDVSLKLDDFLKWYSERDV